jgi:hypothetical protein
LPVGINAPSLERLAARVTILRIVRPIFDRWVARTIEARVQQRQAQLAAQVGARDHREVRGVLPRRHEVVDAQVVGSPAQADRAGDGVFEAVGASVRRDHQ